MDAQLTTASDRVLSPPTGRLICYPCLGCGRDRPHALSFDNPCAREEGRSIWSFRRVSEGGLRLSGSASDVWARALKLHESTRTAVGSSDVGTVRRDAAFGSAGGR